MSASNRRCPLGTTTWSTGHSFIDRFLRLVDYFHGSTVGGDTQATIQAMSPPTRKVNYIDWVQAGSVVILSTHKRTKLCLHLHKELLHPIISHIFGV
uniref:Uncharacterized protein n=1 Tax=Triticum urartu TaxID=4572 RepID=A0A8R7R7B6_TRIUA